MVLSFDVHYRNNKAKVVGILFEWDDISSRQIIIEFVDNVDEYISGEFYKRELPCLIKIIEKNSIARIFPRIDTPIARIFPRNDSAELHSVPTKNCHNVQKIVLF